MKPIDVTPIEIRDYAISYGWSLIKEATKDGLFVLNSPSQDYKQVIIPIEGNEESYKNLADLAINKISETNQKSVSKTIEEIREINDDVLSLRYYSESKIVNSLSFQEALESIEATKQMILAAGSTVINPSLYHKRLARAEATELLKKTRFRHTEEGSFILKISCPVQLNRSTTPLFGETEAVKPVSRLAFENINNGALLLLNAIEENSLDELISEQVASNSPTLSYNFCDALSNLFDDERELPFELAFNWSRNYIHKLPAPKFISKVRFPYYFKDKLDEVKSYFKPESKEVVDTFFGTVESLNGNEGDDGRRAGEVLLALILEGEIINTRASLDADKYDIAYKSHGQGGGFIKVKGKLLPGKRLRMLDEVTMFEAVSK